MSGAQQVTFMNQRSFGGLPAIGGAYEGGFFAGQISTTENGVATHNLVIGPLSTAQSTLAWKTSNTDSPGTASFIDGPTNSSNMNNSSHPAAQFCEGLTIGGFSDWYMPALNELAVCYFNLKPTTENNTTAWGINANAVPKRDSNYTTGVPARTSATVFQTGGAEAFSAATYWSSTQRSSSAGWVNRFDDGGQFSNYVSKTTEYRVRAVRRVPV